MIYLEKDLDVLRRSPSLGSKLGISCDTLIREDTWKVLCKRLSSQEFSNDTSGDTSGDTSEETSNSEVLSTLLKTFFRRHFGRHFWRHFWTTVWEPLKDTLKVTQKSHSKSHSKKSLKKSPKSQLTALPHTNAFGDSFFGIDKGVIHSLGRESLQIEVLKDNPN